MVNEELNGQLLHDQCLGHPSGPLLDDQDATPGNQFCGETTLEEGGQTKLPSGKWAGQTFQQVYDRRQDCVNQIYNRKAEAPCLRNFKMLCRAHKETKPKATPPEAPQPGLPMAQNEAAPVPEERRPISIPPKPVKKLTQRS